MSSFLNVVRHLWKLQWLSIIRHLPFQFDQVREGDTSERHECYGLPREVLPQGDAPCSGTIVGKSYADHS